MSDQTKIQPDGAVDQWHSHVGETAAQASHGDVHPAFIALVGIIGAAFVLASIAVLAIYFKQEVRHQIMDVVEGTNVAVDYLERTAKWDAELTTYGWIDQDAGTVRIPLAQATTIVAAEYESRR